MVIVKSMNLIPFISTFFIITLAELGDKTQLLTMALATRYKLKTVLSGMIAASGILMLLAILVGRSLYVFIPTLYTQIIAGLLFILFGVFALRSDDDEEKISYTLSPFLTVFAAFLLAEFGDKTQLATLALAVKYSEAWHVWLGATLGMVAVNSAGAIVGNQMSAKLPREKIKKAAALVFILFGMTTLLGVML